MTDLDKKKFVVMVYRVSWEIFGMDKDKEILEPDILAKDILVTVRVAEK